MTEALKSFAGQYGVWILYVAVTAVAGRLGVLIKRLYTRLVTDQTKQNVVIACVHAAEQLYRELHGDAKKQQVLADITTILHEKHITISPLELDRLVEAAVARFNRGLQAE